MTDVANPDTTSPNGSRPTLRFFYSPRSGPSRRTEGFLATLLQRRQNHRTFVLERVDCDADPELAEHFAVKQLPTLLVIDRCKVQRRLEGARGCRELEQFLEPWLRQTGGSNGHGQTQETVPDGAPVSPGSTRIELGTPPTRLGLQLSSDLPFERWRALGRRLGGIANSSLWWLADWSAYGEGRYGEKYSHAIAVTGFDYQTLRNYAWVARRFDLSRRRDDLSFAHHAEVAALSPAEQDAWLDRAAEHGWSRNELRRRLREQRDSRETTRLEHVRLRVSSSRAESWRSAAEASGLELAEWLALVADEAAQSGRLHARAA